MIHQLLAVLWIYLPAYVANAAPVVLGGGRPLDGGATWVDGKPLLGSHKTIRGCAVGMLAGALVGVAQGWPTVGVVQGVGAILGDLMSSFVKRRLDLEPGASAPLLDQLDFIVVAALLSQPLTKASHQDLATIILLTVPIHYLANFFSWLFKVKDRPW